MSDLKPGMMGTAEWIVTEEHTAKSVGSGVAGVLATPVMINLIEAAALAAVEPHIRTTQQSLGTYLEISHIAATPVGMKITAVAEIVAVDSRLVKLKVSASDEVEEIGSGVHHRIVVNSEKFAARVATKTSGK